MADAGASAADRGGTAAGVAGTAPTPFFSIVLPTYDCAAWVSGALASIAAQRCRDFEVVVSDGASSDATLARVDEFASRLPALTVLSRPDAGIYDAINRGIDAARGRWVHVLGSDDRYADADVLARMCEHLTRSAEAFVYGDVRVVGANGMVADGDRYGGRFELARLFGQNICQQAVFYRRDLFARFGGFDLRYRLWADWRFAVETAARMPMRWVDVVVCDYAASGASSLAVDTRFLDDRARLIAGLVLRRPLQPRLWRAVLRFAYWHWRTARRGGGRAAPAETR